MGGKVKIQLTPINIYIYRLFNTIHFSCFF
uniref:Uncharacterized protein n=1 Tax=Amphimedon queenslandica TaxID=400682 RepID=A0A1X7SSL8_AMPQE